MSVASKNFFDLLGNDDGDSETPSGPVKTVDKTAARAGKRNEPEAQSKPAPIANRRGNFSGGDAGFRDRAAGGDRPRGKATDDAPRGGARGGYGARVRGGRGSRFPRDRDDRHSKGLPGGGSDKQGAQSSATEGQAELKDEQAGEEIAQSEQKEAIAEGEGLDGDKAEKAEEPEPEDKHISYADYLAQQAEKKLALDSSVSVRKPNEGSKLDKKWAAAKPLVKEDDEEFISGSGGKAKRERERKKKELVEIDNRYIEPDRRPSGGPRGGRGGRGGGRGDHARGDYRGGSRGGGGGGGGGFRGGRGGRENAGGPSINTADKSAFPSLGS